MHLVSRKTPNFDCQQGCCNSIEGGLIWTSAIVTDFHSDIPAWRVTSYATFHSDTAVEEAGPCIHHQAAHTCIAPSLFTEVAVFRSSPYQLACSAICISSSQA